MPKTRNNTNGRKYCLCPNTFLRKKIWKYRDHQCFTCGKTKRVAGSALFFSTKNKSYFNQKLERWQIDFKDYVLVCRDCIAKSEPDCRLKLSARDWVKAKDYSYLYPEAQQYE